MSADRKTDRTAAAPSVLRSFLPKPPRGPPSPTLSISVGSRFRRGRLSEIEPISFLLALLVSVLAFVATDTRWSSLHRLWIDALARMEAQYLDIPIPHGKSTRGTPFRTLDRLDVTEFYCNGSQYRKGQRDRGRDGSQLIPSVTFPVVLTTNCLSSTLPPTPLHFDHF